MKSREIIFVNSVKLKVSELNIAYKLQKEQLTVKELFDLILDINLMALRNLEIEVLTNENKYQDIVKAFDIKGPVLDEIQKLKSLYKEFKDSRGLPYESISKLPIKWYMTLMSTLYEVEGLIILDNFMIVQELWEFFFSRNIYNYKYNLNILK